MEDNQDNTETTSNVTPVFFITPRKKKDNYLSRKKLLSKEENKEYREAKQTTTRINLQEKLKQLKETAKYRQAGYDYSKTKSGRFGQMLSTGISTLQTPGGVTRATYRIPRQIPMGKKVLPGIRAGKRGRPKGTLDPRYAKYGGVYGYRKALALERFKQKQMIMQQSQLTPSQQQALQQIRMREQYQRSNVEGHVIPNTYGDVPLNDIFQDISDSTNLVA